MAAKGDIMNKELILSMLMGFVRLGLTYLNGKFPDLVPADDKAVADVASWIMLGMVFIWSAWAKWSRARKAASNG